MAMQEGAHLLQGNVRCVGAFVFRCVDALELRCVGPFVFWCVDALMLWCVCDLVRWYFGGLCWFFSALVLCCSGNVY